MRNLAILLLVLATSCTTLDKAYHEHAEFDNQPSAVFTLLSTKAIHSSSEVRKAKNVHREASPRCLICNAKSCISNGNRNDVHHLLPVHVRPDLAADPDNLITLCRRHHFWVGHAGSWRSYNENVLESVEKIRETYSNTCNKVTHKKKK